MSKHAFVDSGLIFIGDPCHLVPEGKWDAFADRGTKALESADDVAGIDHGVLIATPDGDGSYPVEVERDPSGRILSVTVRFPVLRSRS
jgi:hypothetical protein